MPTEAERAAIKKYQAARYRFTLRPTREEAAAIRDHAAARGESAQGFFMRAARETMARDRERDRDGKTE